MGNHEAQQAWEQHRHEALVHDHEHYHVTHNHNQIAGGFDHLSSEHTHAHDHTALDHSHYPHNDFEAEHRGEAHDHDHGEPVKDRSPKGGASTGREAGTKPAAAKSSKSAKPKKAGA